MLQDKPSHIDIPENQWKERIQDVPNSIIRKLNAVKNVQTIDMYITAGLYICAVEEFGSAYNISGLLLLSKNTRKAIKKFT
jgi:hypothetical protein